MSIEFLVDADAFWSTLEKDVQAAKDYVYLQTLSFEGDRVGKMVSQALNSARAKDRRVIADDFYTKHRINDHYLHNPKHWFRSDIRRERDATLEMMRGMEEAGVRVLLTNPSGFMTLKVWARNHKKIIAIDDRICYVGGINFTEHNFEWHDMMLRIDDEDITRFLKEDFLSTWDGKHENTKRSFDGMDIYRFDGNTNRKAFEPILDLVGSAKESIYIESPYITYPFFERLEQAVQNGAEVVLLTPEQNNWVVLKEYSMWKSLRCGIQLRHYHDRMMHLKAMLVDDKYLIAGSSNFDFLSWQFLQEVLVVVTDRDAISQFKKRILEKDMAISTETRENISDLRGYYHHARLKTLSWIFNTLGKVITYGS